MRTTWFKKRIYTTVLKHPVQHFRSFVLYQIILRLSFNATQRLSAALSPEDIVLACTTVVTPLVSLLRCAAPAAGALRHGNTSSESLDR